MKRIAIVLTAAVLFAGCSSEADPDAKGGGSSASTTDPDVPLETLPITTPTPVINDPLVAFDAVWVGALAPGEPTELENNFVGDPDPRKWVVYRIDPKTGAVTDTIATAGGGTLLAAGDGAIWATGAKGIVTRIDPVAKRATDEIQVGQQMYTLAAGPGAVWAGVGDSTALDRSIKRIDAASRTVTDTIPVTYDGLVDVLAVGEDYLWALVGGTSTDWVLRIDPRTRKEAGATTIEGGLASWMVPAKGGVWLVPADSSVGPIGVQRVDASGKAGDVVELPVRPSEAIAGSLTGLWAMGEQPDGTVAAMLLDPETGSVRATRTFGPLEVYSGFAVGPDAFWVSTTADGARGMARVGPL